MKQQKVVTQNDVMKFFRAAPLDILISLQMDLNKLITTMSGNQDKRDNIRIAMESKGDLFNTPHTLPHFVEMAKLPTDEGEPVVEVDEEVASDTRSKLMSEFGDDIPMMVEQPESTRKAVEQPESTRSKLMSEFSQDLPSRAQVNASIPSMPSMPNQPNQQAEILEVTVTFVYVDNYGDGLFAVKDEIHRKMFRERKDQADTKKEFFPYGYGAQKDLLKIKKFGKANKGDVMKIKLKISYWNTNGKSGYSCYKVE
jgi:hypothetical protein